MPTDKDNEVYWYEDGNGGRYMYKIPTVEFKYEKDSVFIPNPNPSMTVEFGAYPLYRPKIEKAIFNPPATIVLWSDGTKTVVKCQEGDEWDAEKGLAMAISKKWFYNKGRFNDEFERWLEPQLEIEAEIKAMPVQAFLHDIIETFGKK